MKQHCEELPYKEVSGVSAKIAKLYAMFGAAVAVDGDTLVVGTPQRLRTGDERGHVVIYTWNSSTGDYDEVTRIADPSYTRNAMFGAAVAIHGDTLVVGAAYADCAAGRVYVYKKAGATYALVGVLQASDAQAYAKFGVAVAVQGNRMVVGSGNQIVYVYYWRDNAWVEIRRLVASAGHPHDLFGHSVALHGDRLIVGARGDDDEVEGTGKVYVYEWVAVATTYKEVARLTPNVPESRGWFGSAVAIEGDRLVVSGIRRYAGGIKSGVVYVYDKVGDDYCEVGVLRASDAYEGVGFGSSLALNSGRLAVGNYCTDSTERYAGKVRVYAR